MSIGGDNMKDSDFMTASDVAAVLRCSKSYAYKIMKRVNDERKKGRVHRPAWTGATESTTGKGGFIT